MSSPIRLAGGFVAVLLSGCGAPPPATTRPAPVYLDPNKYVEFIPSPALTKWTQSEGTPKGAKYELMRQSFDLVNGAFNPHTQGSQPVYLEYDDESDPASPCVVKGFAAYTWTCSDTITVCRRFIFGDRYGDANLYSVKGWTWMLMHELLHAYCVPDHAVRNGRAEHFSGPIMCAWSSDCVDPQSLHYQPEDLWLLCKYITGGLCPIKAPQ